MNVLFLHSDTVNRKIYKTTKEKPLYSNDEMQFGISYISAVLKRNGHNTDLFIISRKTEWHDMDEVIKSFNPKVICMTAVFREYETIASTAKKIKQNYPEIFIAAGGPHISLNPEIAIEESFDSICIGEGEYPTLELVRQLEKGQEPTGIKNLWIKNSTGVEKNTTRHFIQDLDEIPFPDRKIWDKWILQSNTPQVILLGRGCHFDCTYCCNHALRKLSDGKYVRFRSPENIISEIDEILKANPQTDTIYLEVEAINLNMEYLREFCAKLEEYNSTLERNVFYGVNYRIIPNQDLNEIFKLFRKANIGYVNIGLESGSERVRSQMMKRNYSNQDVISTIKMAKKYRLLVMLYIILGTPTETQSEYDETLELVKACEPYSVQLNIFCPYPGTELHKYCKERGLIDENHKDEGREVAVIDYPEFSRKEIQKNYNHFYPKLYSKNKVQLFILKRIANCIYRWNLGRLYNWMLKTVKS